MRHRHVTDMSHLVPCRKHASANCILVPLLLGRGGPAEQLTLTLTLTRTLQVPLSSAARNGGVRFVDAATGEDHTAKVLAAAAVACPGLALEARVNVFPPPREGGGPEGTPQRRPRTRHTRSHANLRWHAIVTHASANPTPAGTRSYCPRPLRGSLPLLRRALAVAPKGAPSLLHLRGVTLPLPVCGEPRLAPLL